jgi:hypothetical protein
MTGDYLELTTARLRAFDDYESRNPPESGVVSVTRDTHGRFWQGVALRAAADAAVQRVGGRA